MPKNTPRRTVVRAAILAVAVLLVLLLAANLVFLRVGNARLREVRAELTARAGVTDLASFERRRIPDDVNAARWLEAGAAALVWSPETKRTIGDATTSPVSAWSPEQAVAVRAALEECRPAFDLLQRAVELPESSFGIRYRDGASAELPDLLQLISAGRALMVEARVAFADGDPERAVRALRPLSRLAVALEEEPLLITELVGIACERMLLTVVAEAASADAPWALDPTLLAHLEATVPRHDLADVLRRALAFEGLVISRILSGHPEETESLSPSERLFLRLFTPTAANEVIRQLLAWMDLIEVPYCSAPDRFESKPPEGFVGQAAKGFVPNLRSAIVRNQAVLALRQLTFAALEVRTTAAMTGAYPSDAGSVAALASPSPLTGLPVAYRVDPDRRALLDLPGAAEQVTGSGDVLGRLTLTVVLPPPGVR